MASRKLETSEYTITQGEQITLLQINNCTDPQDHNNVMVNIRVKYIDNSEGQFYDNVNINNGDADHATQIGGYNQGVKEASVIIQWQD